MKSCLSEWLCKKTYHNAESKSVIYYFKQLYENHEIVKAYTCYRYEKDSNCSFSFDFDTYSREHCPICRTCRVENHDAREMIWFKTRDGSWAHRDCYEMIMPCFKTLIEFNEKIIRTKKSDLNIVSNDCFIYNVEAVEKYTKGLSLRDYYMENGERELRVLANTIGIEVSKKYAKYVVETILPDEEF